MFQDCVLGYRIDAYLPPKKLAIEVDELIHQNRDLEAEIERQKAIEERLNCKYIRINPTKKSFNVFDEIGRIQVFIAESNNKSLCKVWLDHTLHN